MQFHEILARERKARGLSQEELAARINVSRQAVSKWETGDAAPDLMNLQALADALELSLDALCGRETPVSAPEPAAAVSSPVASPKSRRAAFPLLFCLLAVLFAIAAVLFLRGRNVVPGEESPVGSSLSLLSEDFTVTGVNFHGISDHSLGYRFTPSISGEGFSYTISFVGMNGKVETFEAQCSGGICSGTARLEGNYGGYTVSVSVTDGVTSRNLAVAENLSFYGNSSSWSPLVD